MDKLISDLLPVLLLAFFLWLGGISAMTWWLFKHIKRLSSGVSQGNLLKVLSDVKNAEDANKTELKNVKLEISQIKKADIEHLQKVGLSRFNPFNETGGDHSFCLCLLDDKDDGFVISCLHTRDRTRVYAKPITKGKSEIKLSAEEKKALEKAKK